MGGWQNTITQKTKLTPAIVRLTLTMLDLFIDEFNIFLKSKNLAPVTIGHTVGSSAYYNVDSAITEYGDIDVQIIVPDDNEKTASQITNYYNNLVSEFITFVKLPYIYEGSIDHGHPIFQIVDSHVQVDLLWNTQRLSKWGRWRVTPQRGVKGLIIGNLFSTLGEIMNMSLQSAVLMKIKDGEPVNYQRTRKFDDVIEISHDIEHFGIDILKFVYESVNKPSDGLLIDSELEQYPGLKIDNVQIIDIVHMISGLRKSFGDNDLYGKFNLKEYDTEDQFVGRFIQHYIGKANIAKTSAKLLKATGTSELAKVDELRNKIDNGVRLVMRAFGET